MTPKKKTANSTSLAMERKRLQPSGDTARKTSIHVAGAGIVIILGLHNNMWGKISEEA